MRNSKIVLGIVLFWVFSLIMSGSVLAVDYEMKIGHSQSVKTPRHKACVYFKSLVEKETNGRIKVRIYPSNQLGTEAEMMETVKVGAIQATLGGQFEAASPKLLIYTMPFLFKDIDSVYSIIRGPIGDKIAATTEKNNIKILATGVAGGLRNFSNNKRPVKTPEDMSGLKMRTPPIDSIIKTVKAIGGNPVSVPYAELYMALKTGVADGQENPFTNMVDKKLYEVQKYLTIVNYQFHPSPLYVSLDWYNSLDSDLKAILKKCAEKMMIYNDKLNREATEDSFEILKDKMEVNYLTEEQRVQFIEKSQAVYDYYIKEGFFTQAEIDEIRTAE
ncbi:DctP family TRAP transporter solute-binding subunit [Iocasia frigidifontis]|uniref:DctP family TRAP transporter solute-binding subunit n=1 Tax=Iocasia fonsfrigidae TaxID=2682810 RepID=A0A8A7KDY9_9FIRM|nr:TRAP transporter substrate-binding protein [Iocasia fonsfrigidae]QTL99631.1 DctP family TRAP transporter solute-binding subunit [Iocasia fonsfrigidae]